MTTVSNPSADARRAVARRAAPRPAMGAAAGSLLNQLRHSGLTWRVVAAALALLIVVQVAGLFALRADIDRNARSRVTDELALGERLWHRLLENNAQRARQGAALLAADGDFRAAVAGGDANAIGAALDAQGGRSGASVAALIDPRFQPRAVAAANPGTTSMSLLLYEVAQPLAREGGAGSRIALVGGQPHQFVMVPVKAPAGAGWVVLGMPLGQALVEEMRALSGLQVALLATGLDQHQQVVASTLPLEARGVLKRDPAAASDSDFVARTLVHDASGGLVHAVLLDSVQSLAAPFHKVQLVLVGIALAGAVLFALGGAWMVRRLTLPLRSLARAAERYGRGDFELPPPHVGRADEIGELAKAFDEMRVNIAANEADIRTLAYIDRLTGLPNRARFRDAVIAAITRADPVNGGVAVVMLDLDRFKHVNDVLGYASGDRLLKSVAERIGREALRGGELVARLSGDEFAVLLPKADENVARGVAQRIATALEQPLQLDDQTVDLSGGIGIACWPRHAASADALLVRAEVAMYIAKRKHEVVVYDPAIDSASAQTLSLLSELKRAVDNGELRLYLQPKIALGDGRLVGAEALVRWQHPERGLVPPMEFIPFAEQTGFVRRLTLWMIERVAEDWAELQAEGPLRVSVNLSTRDLMDHELPQKVDTILKRHGVPESGICLEITESAIMDDPQRAQATLCALSVRGFKLAIDDFGTGYSSLAYLKRLPVDELKIDKSFVMGMELHADDAKIVRSTIDLAHNLGLSVVAEGVESAVIYGKLAQLDCDEAQGFHMSRPLPAHEFAGWARRWRARTQAGQAAVPIH
jgi:diguanylate cyclase (GGDEF)-like protein